ncbi:SDR family NAD(P)-dependent oxidoreductase [Dactylosporangium sp. CA-092794]|uniref:SDR family NAD(P)-dependent oxidoreductase n=1 Tax=Dactylosporangium sp. CA-092794 TaxID=3239929 RepID=UPI003D93DD35
MSASSPPFAARHALVTGAGSGIGAAIARELAARGAAVTVTDIDGGLAAGVAKAIRDEGGTAVPLACDVRDAASVREAADGAEAALGPLDVWVSNAGVSSMHRFGDIPLADWQHNLDVNATGVFICGQVAAARLRRPGVIVNVASMAGKQGRVPYLAHYVASKFAVVGLTQAMAYELGPSGLRVNAVCPGYVSTGMQDRELVWEAGLRGTDEAAVRAAMIADTPLGRLEQPVDVARAVAFLCGADAAFITGEALAVNGGAFMD